MRRTRRHGAVLPESRSRIAQQFKQLMQLQHTARFGTDQSAPSASGITMCEIDTTTYRRLTFFVKPPLGLYNCACDIHTCAVRAVTLVCTNHLLVMLSLL